MQLRWWKERASRSGEFVCREASSCVLVRRGEAGGFHLVRLLQGGLAESGHKVLEWKFCLGGSKIPKVLQSYYMEAHHVLTSQPTSSRVSRLVRDKGGKTPCFFSLLQMRGVKVVLGNSINRPPSRGLSFVHLAMASLKGSFSNLCNSSF